MDSGTVWFWDTVHERKHTAVVLGFLCIFLSFIDVNLEGFYETLFTLFASKSALSDVCDSPHSDEEDEGEEEATQRHSTADERQHL